MQPCWGERTERRKSLASPVADIGTERASHLAPPIRLTSPSPCSALPGVRFQLCRMNYSYRTACMVPAVSNAERRTSKYFQRINHLTSMALSHTYVLFMCVLIYIHIHTITYIHRHIHVHVNVREFGR
jgi:hypothetical protein